MLLDILIDKAVACTLYSLFLSLFVGGVLVCSLHCASCVMKLHYISVYALLDSRFKDKVSEACLCVHSSFTF